MKKALLKAIYTSGGFVPFHWAYRRKVLILTYHRFSRGKEHGKVSAKDFKKHLEYLKKYHRVLPLAETIYHLKNGKSLPANSTVVTIDDGYADAHDVAFPLLKEFGLPATVYAITDFVDAKIWLWTDLMRYVVLNTKSDSISIEFGSGDVVKADLTDQINRLEQVGHINARLKKLPNEQKDAKIKEIAHELGVEIPATPATEFAPMNWYQAREMDADGITIESHTVTHPILTNVEPTTLDFEMQTSKRRLEEVLDRRVGHFCYPNGSLDRQVRDAAKNAGYTSAVTTAYGFNDALTDQFLMNRIDAQSEIENFAQSASGFEAARQGMF